MMNAFHSRQHGRITQAHTRTEQRRHDRTTTHLKAVFKPDGHDAFGSMIGNISLGGAWLETTGNHSGIGSEGKLQIRIGETTLYIIAKVVRTTPEGVGVTFIDMGIETYGNLKTYVDQLARNEAWQAD